jgi:cytoskeleton protein RodZ
VNGSIGSTLREARNRRKIELSEVETATKIRVRYLRALENEEWDVLPGGSYTRSFIRTYAGVLGLDGERLADEYRRASDPLAGDRVPRAEPAVPSARAARTRPLLSTRAWTALVTTGMVAVLVVIGLSTGGGGGTRAPQHRSLARVHLHGSTPAVPKIHHGVSVRLVANAEVWVCLLDGSGKPLIDGQILGSGTQEGPFHSGSFTVSFGNGEVSMLINGQKASIPTVSDPIGYSIDSKGHLQPLPEGQRPSCS